MNLREIFYYMRFGIECLVLRQQKPIVAGISLTDICNLDCEHCVVANVDSGHYPFDKILNWMRLFYARGARILYLQGGEVFTWYDNDKRLNHVIRTAKTVGYFKVAVVTNGTYPIETEADVVWVSIDGLRKCHNKIRGENSFERLIANIESSSHSNICANMTVNKVNQDDVEEVIKFVEEHPKLRGISINFHTPYPEVEYLFLPVEKRTEVIERVLYLKNTGYHILNSKSGLKAMIKGDYSRPIRMIQMIEHGQFFECCWGRQYEGVCEQCGYGIIAELSQLFQLKPSAIIHAFNLFASKGVF